MSSRHPNHIRVTTLVSALLAAAVVAGATGRAAAVTDRTSATEKGSLLIYSKVELRWNANGNLIQDTFIDLTNDLDAPVDVQMYFVNGDPPAEAGELGPGEREHPGWNSIDVNRPLTKDQPSYWSAATGQPGPGGGAVPPFTILDPSPDPLAQGRPAMDGSGDRVLRGFIYAWAVDADDCQIAWNHLKGDALLVNYEDGSAWEYNAWAFQDAFDSLPGTLIGVCGTLVLDGAQYVRPYSHLLVDFYASGSSAFSGGNPFVSLVHDTDLTLHLVSADLRQEGDGPLTTKANFIVWNEDETQLTGLHRCITCWDQTLLSLYAPFGNHFLLANLQTDKGKARVDGIASQVCDVDFVIESPPLPLGDDPRDVISVDAALLGVVAKRLITVGGPLLDEAGVNVIGMGVESATIQYDPVDNTPPPLEGPRETAAEAIGGSDALTPAGPGRD